MKCTILHDLPGRLRVHLCCGRMTLIPSGCAGVLSAGGGRRALRQRSTTGRRTRWCSMTRSVEAYSVRWHVFSFAKAEAMELVPEHTSRALNREFEDKLAVAVMRRCVSKLFLPVPITTALAVFRSVKYIREGLSALLARQTFRRRAGCHRCYGVHGTGRFCHRRLCHVHAAFGRNSGGMDPQKVRGRPRLRHEPAGGQRLAAGKRHRGADEDHRCECRATVS